MLERLKLRDFRCFDRAEIEFPAGTCVLVGSNAQGKTSLLEAIAVLLRLQSPRTSQLASTIRHGRLGLVLDGMFAGRHLQFYYSRERRKLALDSVEQKHSREYLQVGRVVWFSNQDIAIVNGPGELRRRFLDFVGAQVDPHYRSTLRGFETALRSRNRLLKQPGAFQRQIDAFDGPLIESGSLLASKRAALVESLRPHAAACHADISGQREALVMTFIAGDGGDFAANLQAAAKQDLRVGQTTVGPHRDEIGFELNGVHSASASEGQQRSVALALKLAQARLLRARWNADPVLLVDDIFGELDLARRNALMLALPAAAQRFVTTTHLDWLSDHSTAAIFRVAEARVTSE